MIEIQQYKPDCIQVWNQYVHNSKNGTFLFDRNYMDYHSERFQDFSLMIYRNSKLYCLLPANKVDNILYSHQGLTYGGFIINSKVTVSDLIEVLDAVNYYLKEKGIVKVIYKAIPYIYHKLPAQEDLYALFRIPGCRLIARNISSTIFLSNKVKFIESRRSGIRKALKNEIRIEESDHLELFWDILNTNLENRYGVRPVHTLQEMQLLKSRFPENIVLYLAFQGERAIGGTLLYLMGHIVHTQYISASLEGKEVGALDLLFDYLINTQYATCEYFDFGQSTENNGEYLNEALIFQKEGFGGRGVIYDIYEYEL